MKLRKCVSIAATALLFTVGVVLDVMAAVSPKPERQNDSNTPAELQPIEDSLKDLTKHILQLGPQTVLLLDVLPAKNWSTSSLPSQRLKLESSQIERLLPGVLFVETQVEILKQEEQKKLSQLSANTLQKAFHYCIEEQILIEKKLGTFTPEQNLTKLCWQARLAGSLILSKLACSAFIEKSSSTMTPSEMEKALIPEDHNNSSEK